MLGYCCDSYARSKYKNVLYWAEPSGYFSYSVITFRKATITILQVCFQHQNPVYLENPNKYYQEETHYNNYFLWQWEILLPMPHFHEKFIQTNLKQAVFLIVTSPTTTKTYQVSNITKVSSPSAKKFIWFFSYFYNLTKKQISKSMSTYDKIILFAYLLISLG